MTAVVPPILQPKIVYPDTDGLPMAENTLQFEWIVTIKGGLDHLFADRPDVFVAGDLFWYPVEGHPEVRVAPDALVAFGRPKGHRLSYLQWEEGGIAPQVVFEVLSPSNRSGEMMRKLEFYRLHGVEEYYVYDPAPKGLALTGFLRQGDNLIQIASMNGHVSPRLGVRFEMEAHGLSILRPDGKPFLTYEELAQREEMERRRADHEQERASQEHELFQQERERANRERDRAEQERDRAERAIAEAEQLRQRLKELGGGKAG